MAPSPPPPLPPLPPPLSPPPPPHPPLAADFRRLGRLVVRPFGHERAASRTFAANRAAAAAAGAAQMIGTAWAPIAAPVWAPVPLFMAARAAVPTSFWPSRAPDLAAAEAAAEATVGFKWRSQQPEGRQWSARRRYATGDAVGHLTGSSGRQGARADAACHVVQSCVKKSAVGWTLVLALWMGLGDVCRCS